MKCFEISNDKGQEGFRIEKCAYSNGNKYDAIAVGELKIPAFGWRNDENRLLDAELCFQPAGVRSNVPGLGRVEFRKPELTGVESAIVKWELSGRDLYEITTDGTVVAIEYEDRVVDGDGSVHLKNPTLLVILNPGQGIFAHTSKIAKCISVFYESAFKLPIAQWDTDQWGIRNPHTGVEMIEGRS
ncbi:MAG: hypothetical protein WCT08_02550 [Patescibacteria group bacterium]|jgi:hypothetical protein